MNHWTRAALIALRIAVGWHFLYEGLFKIGSDTGATAYSPARYTLQAATGRLHEYFDRAPDAASMTPGAALARADAWYDEIVKTFAIRKPLDEPQKARLGELRDRVKLAVLESVRGGEREPGGPGGVVGFDWEYVHAEVLKIAPEPEPERFTSLGYLQSTAGPFRGLFRALVPDMDGLERLTAERTKYRIHNRYRDILAHFRHAGQPFSPEQERRLALARDQIEAATLAVVGDPAFQSRLADYRALRDRVATDARRLHAAFTRERLDADRKKLDVVAAEMLAYVNEPLAELAAQTQQIATVAQLGTGPFRRPSEPADWIDRAIEWTLVAIGLCLMLGVFTRLAGLAAAAQLAVFYFASPPWPGLPAATLGGHYLYVDRNLIEMCAALVIAAARVEFWKIRRRIPWFSTNSSAASEPTIFATR
jgi:uncharacterized membrane protein YphA (DoxX/SURF4 family)